MEEVGKQAGVELFRIRRILKPSIGGGEGGAADIFDIASRAIRLGGEGNAFDDLDFLVGIQLIRIEDKVVFAGHHRDDADGFAVFLEVVPRGIRGAEDAIEERIDVLSLRLGHIPSREEIAVFVFELGFLPGG